jgi:UDPglucose--hexose-1-phosphate uridylyltransferase
MPVKHESSFEKMSDGHIGRFAALMKPLIGRMEALVPHAAYNWILRTAPWRGDCGRWAHWRLMLLPRVHSFAGLEIGTGIHINPLPPERAAAELRG